jgi:RNA polymerase sigma factor (sigma-70 family)
VTGTSSGPNQPDDATLVELARGGDRAAFGVLFERHRPLLRGLCTRALSDAAFVEDVMQEAALQALLNLGSLRRPERFGPWLGGIGLNICRAALRRAGRADWSWQAMAGGSAGLEPPSREPVPYRLVEEDELRAVVRRAVGSLPRGQRAAVLLFYIRGLTYAEVAAALGIEAGAVRTRLHKARRSLRSRLQAVWEEERMATVSDGERSVPVELADVRGREGEAGARSPRVLILRERGGERQLPIWVGPHEGAAIALLREGVSAPRPLTFEFFAAVLAASGGRLLEVRITRLTQDTYYAIARVEGAGGVAELDARPSDAVALALALGAPIVVSEQVFAALSAAQAGPGYAERVAGLHEFTENAAAIAASMRGSWSQAHGAQQPERPAS